MLKKYVISFPLCAVLLGILSLVVFLNQRQWGVQTAYYANTSWESSAAVSRFEKQPWLKDAVGAQLVGITQFSVTWQGWILISRSGMYRFITYSDDGSWLFIDGQQVVDNGGVHGIRKGFGEIRLEPGVHQLEVRYQQMGGYSALRTFWEPPGHAEKPIPASRLFATHPGRVRVLFRKVVMHIADILKIVWIGLGASAGLIALFKVCPPPKAWRVLAIGALCSVTFWITYSSPVDYTSYDPLGNLVTAQNILEHHTLKMDAYADRMLQTGYYTGWHLFEKNGHMYYHYPVGTPLFSMPFVWVANRFGMDMLHRGQEAALQEFVSAFTSTISCLLIYLICRAYFPAWYSLMFTGAFVLGSQITSTMGSALYNFNFTVVFELLAILVLVSVQRQQTRRINPYLLGFLVFSAYLCRPTAAAFGFIVFAYVLLKNRVVFLKLLATFTVWFGGFVLFSWFEYHQVLPDYYLLSKLGPASKHYYEALYGNLISPSRGVFVQSPYLILTVIGLLVFFRRLYRNALLWMALAWFALHLAIISRNVIWTGIASIGNRYFTDGFPAFIVLTLLVWHIALPRLSDLQRRMAVAGFLLLSAISIFFNSYQGLYNVFVATYWQAIPNPGASIREYVFDWKYPQFLFSAQRFLEREKEYQEKHLTLYEPGETMAPGRDNAVFYGWYWIESDRERPYKWSRGKSGQVWFKMQLLDQDIQEPFVLEMEIGTKGRQRIDVLLNGVTIGSMAHENSQPATYSFPCDPAILKNNRDEYNVIEYHLPNAIDPEQIEPYGYKRAIAMSIWEITLRRQ